MLTERYETLALSSTRSTKTNLMNAVIHPITKPPQTSARVRRCSPPFKTAANMSTSTSATTRPMTCANRLFNVGAVYGAPPCWSWNVVGAMA